MGSLENVSQFPKAQPPGESCWGCGSGQGCVAKSQKIQTFPVGQSGGRMRSEQDVRPTWVQSCPDPHKLSVIQFLSLSSEANNPGFTELGESLVRQGL